MAKQAITAVPAVPPRYGLLIAADVIEDDVRWQQGVEWAPEQCGDNRGSTVTECEGNTDMIFADPNNPAGNPAMAEADPFMVWAYDRCSSIGWEARDYEGRARRALAATESAAIAKEFWTGDLSQAHGLDNTWLASLGADTLTAAASPVDPVHALALLEGALAACGGGRRGMIHVTPQVLIHLRSAYAVDQAGQQIVTPLGTVVVADAGYDGSGPNGEAPGATQWAYATSTVQVRLAPVDVPGTLAGARRYAQQMRRDINLIEVRANRLALVQWDNCCHFAAQVNIAVPLVGGAS